MGADNPDNLYMYGTGGDPLVPDAVHTKHGLQSPSVRTSLAAARLSLWRRSLDVQCPSPTALHRSPRKHLPGST